MVSFIPDAISFLWVDSCVVYWFQLMVNIDDVCATIFLLPLIYYKYRPYSSSIGIHLNTLSVFWILHVRLLWSVYLLNLWPSNTVLNSFNTPTMISSYFSVTLYRFCSSVSFLLWKAIVFPSWKITAPKWKFLASVKILNSSLKSGQYIKVLLSTIRLLSSKHLV